jgi:hypothetical protein
MSNSIKFYGNPVARNLTEARTPRQLTALNSMSMYKGVDVESHCKALLGCEVAQLSVRAASFLIGYLKGQS